MKDLLTIEQIGVDGINEIMHAADVGWSEQHIVLGKHSGRNAFRTRCEELGISFESTL